MTISGMVRDTRGAARAALLVLAACAASRRAPPASSTETSGQPAAAGEGKPQILVYTPAQAKVTMLSAGAGAAAPLRLSPARGRKEYVTLTFGEDSNQSGAGQPPQSFGGTSLSLDGCTEVTSLDERGELRYRTTVEKSELTLRDQPAGDRLTGATIEGGVSTRGVTSRTQVTPPPSAREAEGLDRAYKALATWIILPSDPIAVGAQWEVATRETLSDLEINLVTRYTLTARTPTTATISGEIKVVSVDPPPPYVEVVSLAGEGRLEATITQGRLYPQLERVIRFEVSTREAIGDDHLGLPFERTIEVHHGFSLPLPQDHPTP